MKRTLISLGSILLASFIFNTEAQTVRKVLTLDEVLKIAETQSPAALMAKHRFRASYWQYRSFRAQYLPALTLSGTVPDFNNGLEKLYNSQLDQYIYRAKTTVSTTSTLSLSQAIGPLGTTISLSSDLTLYKDIEKKLPVNYITNPVSININQPIRRYNTLKWQARIEPIRYEMAKKEFLNSMEEVHMSAVQNFFMLALAQINKQISEMNYSNADTLYRIAQGRYQLGTIAEDDLLQMQLSFLNAETSRKQSVMNLRDRQIRLASFLGYNENVEIELVIPSEIPNLQVDMQEVLELALKNNPDIVSQRINTLNAQSSLAQAKNSRGITATMFASLGFNQQSNQLIDAYNNLSNSQRVRIGFNIPIVDWGQGRGRYRMALSSLELAEVQEKQAMSNFQQNLFLDVAQFNLQAEQVAIAAKSDTVATRRYEVTKARFLIGKISVLDLNDADTRKDTNRRAYIQALQAYWSYFYNIRALTLYDFINRKPIEVNFDELL